MLRAISHWIKKLRLVRQRWLNDAGVVLQLHGPRAYYEAQRFASRAKAHHDRAAFWH